MGVIRNIKDWFNERGDDIFRINRKVEELVDLRILPEDVVNTLERLEESNSEAITNYKNAGIDFSEASDKRTKCYDKLVEKQEEFKKFKKEHHGFFGKILYNTILRFFPTGREYQRLRREIKNLKKEHKFWTRYCDESSQILRASEEYRKEAKRTLAEYKRIIVDKAKTYKKEIKLLIEYDKLMKFDKNTIINYYGEEIANRMDSKLKEIKENWFSGNTKDIGADVTTVTNAIIKIWRNQSLNDEELIAMRDFGKSKTKQQNNNLKDQIKPPVVYADYGLDRRAIEKLLSKSPLNLKTPEDFLIVMGFAQQSGEDMVKTAKDIKEIKDNNSDSDLLKFANDGALMFSEMLQGNSASDELKPYINAYKIRKAFLDAKGQAKSQNQQQNQGPQK